LTKQYEKKWRVPSDSRTHECKKLCKKLNHNGNTRGELPPCLIGQEKITYWRRKKNKSRCPHSEILGKPIMYIVAKTLDGDLQCSCPVWKFRRIVCKHIKAVQSNPSDYEEITPEFTGRTTEVMDKIFAKFEEEG